MRVLLCADIHANADALGAVLADPADYVLCAGDLVHFGPAPIECLDLIGSRASVVVRGNHDHGAGFGEDCRAYGPWRPLDEASRQVTDAMLSQAHRQYLRSLPLEETITLGGIRFAIVHAVPSDPLYHYLSPGTPDEVWAAEIACTNADVLVLGHTHLPLLAHANVPDGRQPRKCGPPAGWDAMRGVRDLGGRRGHVAPTPVRLRAPAGGDRQTASLGRRDSRPHGTI